MTITSPLTRRLTPIAGAFISINSDKGLKVHALKDALILQGRINPGLIPAAQVTGTLPPDVAPFLRDQSFEQYRRDGWRVNEQGDLPLAPGEPSAIGDAQSGVDPLTRKSVAITVKVQGGNGDRLLSVGQPLRSDHAARSSTGSTPGDVGSLEAEHHLSNCTQYTIIGSVSAATVDQLRAAGTAYPDWVTQSYLQLSRRLPSESAPRRTRSPPVQAIPTMRRQQSSPTSEHFRSTTRWRGRQTERTPSTTSSSTPSADTSTTTPRR